MNTEFDALIQGEHSNPHRVLGVHPFQQANQPGVTLRAFHPDALEVFLIGGSPVLPLARIHPGGFSKSGSWRSLWPFEYRFRFVFEDGKYLGTGGPLPFPAHPGRRGPVSVRRGDSHRLMKASGRSFADHRGKERHGLYPLGAQCQDGSASWVNSTAGTAVSSPCGPWAVPASGNFSCPGLGAGTPL